MESKADPGPDLARTRPPRDCGVSLFSKLMARSHYSCPLECVRVLEDYLAPPPCCQYAWRLAVRLQFRDVPESVVSARVYFERYRELERDDDGQGQVPEDSPAHRKAARARYRLGNPRIEFLEADRKRPSYPRGDSVRFIAEFVCWCDLGESLSTAAELDQIDEDWQGYRPMVIKQHPMMDRAGLLADMARLVEVGVITFQPFRGCCCCAPVLRTRLYAHPPVRDLLYPWKQQQHQPTANEEFPAALQDTAISNSILEFVQGCTRPVPLPSCMTLLCACALSGDGTTLALGGVSDEKERVLAFVDLTGGQTPDLLRVPMGPDWKTTLRSRLCLDAKGQSAVWHFARSLSTLDRRSGQASTFPANATPEDATESSASLRVQGVSLSADGLKALFGTSAGNLVASLEKSGAAWRLRKEWNHSRQLWRSSLCSDGSSGMLCLLGPDHVSSRFRLFLDKPKHALSRCSLPLDAGARALGRLCNGLVASSRDGEWHFVGIGPVVCGYRREGEGQLAWTFSLEDDDGVSTMCAKADGLLLVGTSRGRVYLLPRQGPGEQRPEPTVVESPGRGICHLCASGDARRLLVLSHEMGTRERLVLCELPGGRATHRRMLPHAAFSRVFMSDDGRTIVVRARDDVTCLRLP